MCGIAGIYAYDSRSEPADINELNRIRDAMSARGPDGAGTWIDPTGRVGFAHRRLAIIDLSENGLQPMLSWDGRFAITFNGEIYNYRTLRERAIALGSRFRSNSDTEVIIELYRHLGTAMLAELRGMFAFALWDTREESMLLARDPLGIKPLYYSDSGTQVRIASQVRALIAGGAIAADIDPLAQMAFHVWGAVPEPRTVYRSIKSLPAGCHLRIDRQGVGQVRAHFSLLDTLLEAEAEGHGRKPDSLMSDLHDALQDSIRAHLVADVPVGLFLSAGIDSNLIARHAVDISGTRLNAITLSFSEFANTEHDESGPARAAARELGLNHEVREVSRADFGSSLERYLQAMDQPSTDGVNSYHVSRVAHEAGMKVALSGLGGDELLAGYPGFRQIPKLVGLANKVPGGIRRHGRSFRRLVAPVIPTRLVSPKYAGLLEHGGDWFGAYLLRRAVHMPWEPGHHLSRSHAEAAWECIEAEHRTALQGMERLRTPALKITFMELSLYLRNQLLRDTDWCSMAHGLEVRVPFLDVPLLRTAARALAGDPAFTKSSFAAHPRARLPEGLANRPKTGFSVPIREWMMADGREARGVRGWARLVADRWGMPKGHIAFLVTDIYGTSGGIAKFNRDVADGLDKCFGVASVDVHPRVFPANNQTPPPRISVLAAAARGKLAFVGSILRSSLDARDLALIICGHINLVPVAWLLGKLTGKPVLLFIHGIDAWTPPQGFAARVLAPRLAKYVAVSRLTADRFRQWSGVAADRMAIIPNCVDLRAFTPGPASAELLDRYHLRGKRVLLTVGRLVSKERYKGFDEVINALAELLPDNPDLHYLVVGDGDDRPRLEARVAELGLARNVTFAGFVSEHEKQDHYRLASAYVMPSRGEGFGIVLLEALACGIPVMASKADGTRDALLDGQLGLLVDPNSADEVRTGILATLARQGPTDACLSMYDAKTFHQNVATIVLPYLRRSDDQQARSTRMAADYR